MTNLGVSKAVRAIVMKVSGLEQVYLADQANMAPSGAYATIRVSQSYSATAIGGTRSSYNKKDRTITTDVFCPVRYDIAVNFYRGTALDYAQSLINCSRLPSVHATLLKNKLGWAGNDPVQNLTALQSSQQEERAAIVLHLIGTKRLSETVNTIEAASVTVEDEKTNVIRQDAVNSD